VQFIDAVRQQMRPLQALPAPDRIIDIERHISPPTLPRPAARRTQIRLPPGKSARPAKLALLRPRRQEGTRLKRAPLRTFACAVAIACVSEEPSAGIAVEPIQVRGQVRQVP